MLKRRVIQRLRRVGKGRMQVDMHKVHGAKSQLPCHYGLFDH